MLGHDDCLKDCTQELLRLYGMRRAGGGLFTGLGLGYWRGVRTGISREHGGFVCALCIRLIFAHGIDSQVERFDADGIEAQFV